MTTGIGNQWDPGEPPEVSIKMKWYIYWWLKIRNLLKFEPSGYAIAQFAHFGWGCWPVAVIIHHSRYIGNIAILLSFLYITIKEIVDVCVHGDSIENSLIDFVVWNLGIITGALA